MLYVGAGASDLPAFDLLERHGGLAVGVLHAERAADWKAAKRMHDQARVENLAPAEYGGEAPMRKILTLSVEILGRRVAPRRLAVETS